MLRCRRDFHRARTAADTAAVDARTFPVADTTVDCALMRTRFADAMRGKLNTGQVVFLTARMVAMLGAIVWLGGVVDRARGVDH
ncbi:hypothetical protein [Longimicrobium sp.]|uniref:hypothetical protein n=1 Tax=Longimicrobium sp. TaxID=2029185 RepID=UPI002D7E420F|nr:hypothetical protein [Longimicrobium sp.]